MRKTSRIGDVIIELSEIDSTNNYAMKLVNEGMAEHGLVVRADWQTAGRGQLGNSWISEESKNLLLSLVIDSSGFAIEKQYLLNAMTCVALGEMLMSEYQVANISIKWPNDIYAGSRKISGILIENIIRGQVWSHAIVGVGLNVNQQKFADLNRATSLYNETGKTLKTNLVGKRLMKFLNEAYERLLKNEDQLFMDYNKMLYGFNEAITLKKNNELLTGIMRGVSEHGLLEIEFDKKIRRFKHKEIDILLS
jgi:BirA family biotin operon repressor/biotin-[acetyl-CoA-carboxylase] ligase